MRISRRYWLFVALLIVLLIFFYQWVKNIAEIYPSGRFSVTISNKSDYDLMSVETGIVSGASKDLYDKKIIAGAKAKIIPELRLTGEGAVYLKYTDSKGDTTDAVVCGYTESLSGRSTVTIYNDRVDVKQNCL
jgi:hypothetical protein